MSTPTQTSYIEDLAVLKTKEFKEVKELIYSSGIVDRSSNIVAEAATVAEICNALTDYQASRLIDALTAAKAPTRARAYAATRSKKTIDLLDGIKADIDDWGF